MRDAYPGMSDGAAWQITEKFKKSGETWNQISTGAVVSDQSRILTMKREVSTVSVRNYQFDMTGMGPEERERAAEGAQGIVHMEEGAGRTMAQKLLPARDLLNEALAALDNAKFVDGFGDLPTGHEVTQFYSDQAAHITTRIKKDRDDVQRDIDHFLAMELLYKNTDDYNAGNFGAYKASVVY